MSLVQGLIHVPTGSRILILLRSALTLLAIAWILRFFYQHWSDFIQATADIEVRLLVIAMFCVLIGLMPGAWAWQRLLAREMPKVTVSRGILIYLRSGIGKYTPGGMLTFALQHRLLQKEGAEIVLLLRVFTGTALAACLAAALLGLPSAARMFNLSPWLLAVPGMILSWLMLSLACLRGQWPFFSKTLSSIGVPPPEAFTSTVIIMSIAWSLTGLHLSALGHHTEAGAVFLVSAYAFSAIAGIVFSILPGAFGVRDGALLLILAARLEPADAMILALLSRSLIVVGDVIGTVSAALVLQRKPFPKN